MKFFIAFWLTFGIAFLGFTQQKITYTEHIQPIIAKNCVMCHRPGGIGPFSLLSYEDVAKRSEFVAKVTQIKYMPPFPADKAFQHYANQRGLDSTQIDLIQQWVNQGSVEGKKKKNASPSLPNTPLSLSSRTPDLTLKMANAFTIPNTGIEEFRYFHIPTHLTKDVMVEAIEFVPGNRKVVHHSRVMVDTSGRMGGLEGMEASDPRLVEFQKIPMADQFLYGWVPGNDRIQFPTGVAKKIPARANLVLNIHYSPSSKIQTDQSRVNLYFAKAPVKREIQSMIFYEEDITNPPFYIQANAQPKFYMSKGPIQEDISAISVLPHMHWLGKSFKAFAITPDGDLVPLIKIDNWDFNWQMTYQFSTLLPIPKGSVIIAEAEYDNTEANPLNPFKPTRDISYGWSSTSEMMEMVLYYVKYQPGDETLKQ